MGFVKKNKGGTRNGHKTKAGLIYTMECVLYIQHCLVLDKKKNQNFFFLMGKKIWTENPSKKKWRKKKWGFQILGGVW